MASLAIEKLRGKADKRQEKENQLQMKKDELERLVEEQVKLNQATMTQTKQFEYILKQYSEALSNFYNSSLKPEVNDDLLSDNRSANDKFNVPSDAEDLMVFECRASCAQSKEGVLEYEDQSGEKRRTITGSLDSVDREEDTALTTMQSTTRTLKNANLVKTPSNQPPGFCGADNACCALF